MFSTDTYSANIRIKEYINTAAKLNAHKETRKKEVKANVISKMFGRKTA